MRLLFLGDVMGRSGRDAISQQLPSIIERYRFDFVVVNGENASHGKGLTEPHFNAIRNAGADVVTLGDHAFDQRETISFIERETTLIRPINMPPGGIARDDIGGDLGIGLVPRELAPLEAQVVGVGREATLSH